MGQRVSVAEAAEGSSPGGRVVRLALRWLLELWPQMSPPPSTLLCCSLVMWWRALWAPSWTGAALWSAAQVRWAGLETRREHGTSTQLVRVSAIGAGMIQHAAAAEAARQAGV